MPGQNPLNQVASAYMQRQQQPAPAPQAQPASTMNPAYKQANRESIQKEMQQSPWEQNMAERVRAMMGLKKL